jgi:hypothetical protein
MTGIRELMNSASCSVSVKKYVVLLSDTLMVIVENFTGSS